MTIHNARTGSSRISVLRFGVLLGAVFGIGSASRGVAPVAADRAPTYTKDVAPILQKKCQNCHRRGQVGPFALETYEQARKRASDIAAVVEDRQMPPWKPAPGVGPKLKHDTSLTTAEIAVLQAWAEAGAPRGEEKHLPIPKFTEGWRLGTPDMVLEMPEEYQVPASGADVYRCFILPTNLTRDVYITAIDFRPGNPRVVHHISAFIDTTGFGRKRDAADPGPGYTSYSGAGVPVAGEMGGWTAGNQAQHLPDGVGRLLPSQSDLILQVHYHPSGKPEKDRTRVGIYLSRKPIKQAFQWKAVESTDFRLPAGHSKVEVKATWFVPVDVDALAVNPHMHALGKDMRITVTYPDGRSRDLLFIPDWDPSWQDTYYFAKPIPLPRGSIVKVVAHFDNSAHARNPHNPPKAVKYGHEVDDEMCIGHIGVVKKGQDLTKPGQKDDLFKIFQKQFERSVRRQQAAASRP